MSVLVKGTRFCFVRSPEDLSTSQKMTADSIVSFSHTSDKHFPLCACQSFFSLYPNTGTIQLSQNANHFCI